MKKMMASFAALLLLATVALRVNAAQYVENKQLSQVVTAKVGDVKSGTIPLPVITWGGDVATLLANGGDVKTQPNSLFAAQKLDFKIIRKDVFADQVKDYIAGTTPYIRGTLGMINQSLSALKDPRLRPVVVYQMTWSSGGDVLVVRPSVKDASDLRGKTIVVQAYGPHVDFMVQTLKDAGVDVKDVTIKYVKDITGTDDSPDAAFRADPSVDAVFCISPDADNLTGGPGKVGTGAEKSVKGAHYLMSTKTADHVIADVYAVRSDYLAAHPAEVEAFVNALMNAQEQLADLSKSSARKAEYDKFMTQAAFVYLDSKDAVNDAKGLLDGCTFVGYQGNIKFFSDSSYPRRFDKISSENQTALIALGLLSSKTTLASAGFDYSKIKQGLRNTAVEAESPRFDAGAVAALVAKKGDALNSVFTFEIQFEPNMADFDSSKYADQFTKVIEMVSTYSGAILTVEGHTDPNKYLSALRSENTPQLELKQIMQVNINTSLKRANRVKEELVAFATSQGVKLDESQITTVGQGCMKPKKGVEKTGPFKGQPLPSLNEAEWRANMRVVFRVANVEAESELFTPVK
ncbi:MAG: ABC transporter substrate-binding protein [Candidatus Pacebacteria bacterium]|nr:ABC transporter substrate-binding protein [Candidatus Paceibacterota bacterium]